MFRTTYGVWIVLLSLLGVIFLPPLAVAQTYSPAVYSSAANALGVNVKAPPPGITAAKGDNAADDTAALQAQIQYCQDHNVPLLLPPGLYRITAPLRIAIPPPNQTETFVPIQSGIVIRGLTNHAVQPGLNGPPGTSGVTILMAGPHQDALIEIEGASSCHMVISDVSLDGGPESLGTKYGIHAGYTRWSGLRLDNIQTMNVDTAIGITGTSGTGARNPPGAYSSTGRNGENLDCYSCHLNARHCCYLNTADSGQAYLHHMFGCALTTLKPGGIAFEIGEGNLGNQCDFYGTSLTMAPGNINSPNYQPNVFFKDDGTTDPINWWGGRAENVDTVIQWRGFSVNQQGRVNIEGMAFTIASGKGALLFGGGANCQYAFCLRSCYFNYFGKPVPLGFVYGGGGLERITFDDCDFLGWSDMKALTDSPRTVLRSCRYTTGPDPRFHDLVHRQLPPDGPR